MEWKLLLTVRINQNALKQKNNTFIQITGRKPYDWKGNIEEDENDKRDVANPTINNNKDVRDCIAVYEDELYIKVRGIVSF